MEKQKVFKFYDSEIEGKSIAYFSHELKIHKAENSLIGDFNADGKYCIDEETAKTLLKLFKVSVKKEDEREFLICKCEKKSLDFVIDYSVEGEEKFAVLKLVEKVRVLFEEDKLVTPLVYVKEKNDDKFDEKIRKLFNIINEDESEGKKKDNEELLKPIFEKIEKSKKIVERYYVGSKRKDKTYVQKMLSIFEAESGIGQFCLGRYKKLLKEYAKVLDPKKTNYYRLLKQIVDKVVLENKKSINADMAQKIDSVREKYTKYGEIIFASAKNPKVIAPEKEIKLGKGVGNPKFEHSKGSKGSSKKKDTKYSAPLPFDKKKHVENEKTQSKESKGFDLDNIFNIYVKKQKRTIDFKEGFLNENRELLEKNVALKENKQEKDFSIEL